jgi:hypothetical protein
MYFKEFNKLIYNTNQGANAVAVDIFNSIFVQYKPAYDITIIYYYTVKDGQNMEDVAFDYYGSPKYTWIIILMNNIINPYYDWPMSYQQFNSYIKKAYGTSKDDIRYFTDMRTNRQVDDIDHTTYQNMVKLRQPLPHYISPTSNYQYEFDKNDAKREIKLLNVVFLRNFTEQFMKIMERQD